MRNSIWILLENLHPTRQCTWLRTNHKLNWTQRYGDGSALHSEQLASLFSRSHAHIRAHTRTHTRIFSERVTSVIHDFSSHREWQCVRCRYLVFGIFECLKSDRTFNGKEETRTFVFIVFYWKETFLFNIDNDKFAINYAVSRWKSKRILMNF